MIFGNILYDNILTSSLSSISLFYLKILGYAKNPQKKISHIVKY